MSGPLLDRFDLHLEMPPVDFDDLTSRDRGEASLPIRERVATARARQFTRNGPAPRGSGLLNARLPLARLEQHCAIDPSASDLLRRAMDRLSLSARAHHRILKVARTIADLAGGETIEPAHIAEAIQYRCLDGSDGVGCSR